MEHKHYAAISPVRPYSSRTFSRISDSTCTVIRVQSACHGQASRLLLAHRSRCTRTLREESLFAPSLASHSLKTSSWALAVSNLKLLSFLILQNSPRRHIIFSILRNQSVYLAPFAGGSDLFFRPDVMTVRNNSRDSTFTYRLPASA